MCIRTHIHMYIHIHKHVYIHRLGRCIECTVQARGQRQLATVVDSSRAGRRLSSSLDLSLREVKESRSVEGFLSREFCLSVCQMCRFYTNLGKEREVWDMDIKLIYHRGGGHITLVYSKRAR